jgi:hypothetical protein
MRHILIAIVALPSVAVLGSAWANEAEGLRTQFAGSPDLPTGIAFQTFLTLTNTTTVLEGTDPSGVDPGIMDLVSTALAIPISKETKPIVESRVQLFRDADNSLRHEKRMARKQMLCSEDRGHRAKEQTYDLLNAVDDVQEVIAEKHYLLIANGLSPAEKKALDEYLNRMKGGISYSKVDERSYFESHQVDVKSAVETRCIELANATSRNGEDR